MFQKKILYQKFESKKSVQNKLHNTNNLRKKFFTQTFLFKSSFNYSLRISTISSSSFTDYVLQSTHYTLIRGFCFAPGIYFRVRTAKT